MLLVGLTGGIASGKSLVTRVLRELGAHVIDADKIVHNMLAPGEDANREVVEYFGAEILLPDGAIDRRRLGDIVFGDADKRAWLNRCIHPRVFEVYHSQTKHIADRDPGAIVIFDAALLIETGYHRRMDKLIVVYASPENQIRRLHERDRFTEEQARARIGSQMPLEEKKRFADYIIDNRGSREETEQQVRTVFEQLRREASERI